MTHIVVLGAGYSGQLAANLAARRAGATVTLVNDRETFVERVRLHQLATGQRLREHRIADLLRGTGAALVVDRVTRIDPAARTVELSAGEPLRYDTLIYALGSRADLESVPGVAEHAFTVAGAEQALRLRERIAAGGTVTVVGGGLTGIEAATELAESSPDLKVRLLSGDVLGTRLSARGRRYLRATVDRLGIELRDEARVTAVRADGVELTGGEHVGSDVVVWTTGFTVPPLAREAGLAVDDTGRMIVDDTMRSVSHQDVYGVGDAAAVRAVTARLAGREPKPFRFRFVNQCISLGRKDGIIQFVRDDDSPREAVLTGRLAALYKELIVRGALRAQRHPSLPTSL